MINQTDRYNGPQKDDPIFHKKYTEAAVMTFVAHCTTFSCSSNHRTFLQNLRLHLLRTVFDLLEVVSELLIFLFQTKLPTVPLETRISCEPYIFW